MCSLGGFWEGNLLLHVIDTYVSINYDSCYRTHMHKFNPSLIDEILISFYTVFVILFIFF